MTHRRLYWLVFGAPSLVVLAWIAKDCACQASGSTGNACPRDPPPAQATPEEPRTDREDRLNRLADDINTIRAQLQVDRRDRR